MNHAVRPRELRTRLRGEAGIGLTEVLVAIVLLGILAAAFLPVLIGSMQLAANNVTATKASQLLADEFEQAQAQEPSCTALQLFASRTTMPVPDSRGVQLQVSRELDGGCPASYPGTMSLSAEVVRLDTETTVTSAVTSIFITGP